MRHVERALSSRYSRFPANKFDEENDYSQIGYLLQHVVC